MGQFETRRIGNATMIALQDSWATLAPTAFFGAVEAAAWEPYRELLDADGNMFLNLGAWLVRSAGQTILIDTGIGGRPVQMPLRETPELPAVMRAAGVAPEEVDTVVFSHLHFDHTGWNTVDEDGGPRPLFTKARHVVQRREWEHWTGSDSERQAARYEDVLAPLERADLLDLIDGEREITSELVAILTPGHTPGHMSFILASGGERAYMLGDVAHHPVQVTEPSWSPNADIDPRQSAATRAALFDRIEREHALIASGHFAFPGLGRVVRDGERLRFQPLGAGE
jgi:glyoxylase-like metal-dependent hydrolase (beta-lactamase superfamily II)